MNNDTILDVLQLVEGSDTAPFHMPGHKRNSDLAPYLKTLGAQMDITEITGSDSLHHPDGIIKRAMDRARDLWGADHSYISVNGSTGGILAGIHATTVAGDGVLMARGCHKSVYSGVALCGLQVAYLTPPQQEEGYYEPLSPQLVEEGLRQHPNTRLVVITSPTYEGYISDVASIAQLCHRQGAVLMVDEAHGSHLGFCNYFAGAAVQGGADIVVQSLHKTLPSLTQTAVVHIQGKRVNHRQFSSSLSIFQTTSPSYLLMASVDGCLQLMEKEGATHFARWQRMLEEFYGAVEGLQHLRVVREPSQVKDPSKIIMSTAGVDLDGVALKEILYNKYDIELEMAYGEYALAMTGMGEQAHHLARLSSALLELDGTLAPVGKKQAHYALPQIPLCKLPPHQTRNRPVTAKHPEEAVGEICASYIWAYPPGVPLIVPGEVIDGSLLLLLEQLERSGVDVQDSLDFWPEKIGTIDGSNT